MWGFLVSHRVLQYLLIKYETELAVVCMCVRVMCVCAHACVRVCLSVCTCMSVDCQRSMVSLGPLPSCVCCFLFCFVFQFIYVSFLWMSVLLHVCWCTTCIHGAHGGQKRLSWPCACLWAFEWVLGNDPGFSERVASAFNCGAVSPASSC